MQTKVYVVTEVQGTGERVVAVRLTHGAARAIAKQGGGRRVEPWIATKSEEMHPADEKNDCT